MRGSWRVFRGECFRLLHSRVAHLAALFLLVVPALHVAAARFVDSAARLEAARNGRELLGLEEGRGWAPMVGAWRVGLALGALLLLISGARSIAGDRDSGLMRLASTRSASRSGLVIGRVLVGPLLVFLVVALSALGAWLPSMMWFDFGPLMEDGYLILDAAEVRHELMLSIASALPALWAIHTFGLLVSSISRGATIAVASTVAVFLAFDLFKGSLGEARYWFFATYSPSFVDDSAMREMVGLAHGYSDAGFPESLLRMSFVLPGPQALLFALIAASILTRRRL
ncbi:MAG: hypothetical protein ACI8X5_002883 [Planctomycetota bacterium]|jgi:hypothetical protein